MSRDRKYPLRLPAKEAEAVDTLCEQASGSFNQGVVLCGRKGLPTVRELLTGTDRITNVDPLSDKELARLYTDREDDERSIRRIIAAQPKGE